AYPAFDQAAIDGYAARWEDLSGAGRAAAYTSSNSTAGGPRRLGDPRPVRLNVVGDLGAASWRPVRLTPGACFSVAAGAPLPLGADVVVPVEWTDQGMAAVEIFRIPKRGFGLRRAGEEVAPGTVLARSGTYISPALVALLAA